MNLILLEPDEARDAIRLTAGDPRAVHLRTVLKVRPGDRLDVGLRDGPRGAAQVTGLDPDGAVQLAVTWQTVPPPPLAPVDLLVAYCRPQAARRILQQAAALGVARLIWFPTDRSEPGYATSPLWSTDEWRKRVDDGIIQAFATTGPVVRHSADRAGAVAQAARPLYVLDNYEGSAGLDAAVAARGRLQACALAVGGERGWSQAEREAFQREGGLLVHLGERVLRTDTAVVAGLAVLQAAQGYWRDNTAGRPAGERKPGRAGF
ncbi:MAG: 16S rRNA (uracil(1498)-N(3))-methyltransferase [Opitutales bacterium]